MGAVLSWRLASLRELEHDYSYGDMLDMLEIILVNIHNRRAAHAAF